MVYIKHKNCRIEYLKKKFPNAEIIDVTSKGNEPFVKFSPFYPLGNIPVPFTNNKFAISVEGLWQGLKVFKNSDVDESKFYIDNMKNIKRSEKKFGKILGHRKGIYGNELLDYKSAREIIYVKTYKWVLDNLLKDLVELLKEIALKRDLILLDYNTNIDINNIEKPLSHAGLIKMYLEEKYPEVKQTTFSCKKINNIVKVNKKMDKNFEKYSGDYKKNRKKLGKNNDQLLLF